MDTRLFLSFSSADSDVAKRLFSAARRQPFDLWDYSDEGAELELGRDVADQLRERVAQCQVFVPLISDNSMASEFTTVELETAVPLQPKVRIVPMLLDDRITAPVGSWPAPFQAIVPMCHWKLGSADWEAIERGFLRICNAVGVRYEAPYPTDSRLPILAKLDGEWQSAMLRDQRKERTVYGRLDEIRVRIVSAVSRQRWAEAITAAKYFCLTCDYEFEAPLYYPYIVLGVCQLAVGDYKSAEESLLSVVHHKKRDENYYGLRAAVRFMQGRYGAAARLYGVAHRLKPDDPAAGFNLIESEVLSNGISASTLKAVEQIAEHEIPHAQDRRRVDELKAFCMLQRGDIDDVVATVRAWDKSCEGGGQAVKHLALALEDSGRLEEAFGIMEHCRPLAPRDPDYLLLLAQMAWATQRSGLAFDILQGLRAQHPARRDFAATEAHLLCLDQNWAAARQTAREMLACSQSAPPSSRDDFYYDGMAQYMLGDRARSQYDFERSGRPNGQFYDRLLPEGQCS